MGHPIPSEGQRLLGAFVLLGNMASHEGHSNFGDKFGG